MICLNLNIILHNHCHKDQNNWTETKTECTTTDDPCTQVAVWPVFKTGQCRCRILLLCLLSSVLQDVISYFQLFFQEMSILSGISNLQRPCPLRAPIYAIVVWRLGFHAFVVWSLGFSCDRRNTRP